MTFQCIHKYQKSIIKCWILLKPLPDLDVWGPWGIVCWGPLDEIYICKTISLGLLIFLHNITYCFGNLMSKINMFSYWQAKKKKNSCTRNLMSKVNMFSYWRQKKNLLNTIGKKNIYRELKNYYYFFKYYLHLYWRQENIIGYVGKNKRYAIFYAPVQNHNKTHRQFFHVGNNF